MPNPKPLIIVSGFPRTGTSTMMRMLHLGGVSVLAAKEKMVGSHEFDPYGDYELLPHKLKRVKVWKPAHTSGKAVKIIAPYIPSACPLDRPVRVLFMLRDSTEIIASLLAMRIVWEWTPIDAVKYARNFIDHHKLPVKYIQYADMYKYPRSTASDVNDWLGFNLDIDSMASAVDRNARTKVKGKGGQKRLATYRFDRALVNDVAELELSKEERSL